MSDDRPAYVGKKKPDLQAKIEGLCTIVIKTLWMARRYADMRCTYAVGDYNDAARLALDLGLPRARLQTNGALYARDGHGRRFDRLSDEELAACEQDMPARWVTAGYIALLEAVDAEAEGDILAGGEPVGAHKRAIEAAIARFKAECLVAGEDR